MALAQAYTADALPQKSKSVQKDYSRYIQYWISQFGNKNLCEITPGQIKRCRDKLSKEVITRSGNGKGRVRSPATCNRYVMCLSSMFSFAKQETAPGSDNEWMSTSEANPCSSVKMLKEPDGRVRFLSKDELKRYLDACEKISPPLHTASMIALTTGGRRMEVWDLKRADIKLGDKPMVTFRETKNGEVRSVKLVAEAVELFQKLPRRLDTLQVFPGKENPHQNYDFRYPFQKALEMAQISDFSWHDLRHKAASYLKMTGVDDRTIMEIMGWKSWSMLKRYTHLTVEHIGDAQDRLSQVYG